MENKLKQMSKNEEIELLEKLKNSNSYFRNFFGVEDITQMQENIRNNSPLDLECNNFIERSKINDEVWEVQMDMETLKNNHRQQLKEIYGQMIYGEDCCSDVVADADSLFDEALSQLDRIYMKRENDIMLSDDDIEYLVANVRE